MEAERIGRDTEKQQERDHRMLAKDDPGGEIAHREIGRHGYGPAAGQHRLVEHVDQTDMDQRGDRGGADRGDDRQQGAPLGMENAAGAVASTTSFVITAKNSIMATSLTAKAIA